MSGFYGQVIYEFSKIFSTIKTKNNSNENEFTATSNEAIIPVNQWDTFNVESANKWIQINSTKNDSIIKIGHGAPGKTPKKTINGLQVIGSDQIEGKDITALSGGEYFAIPNQQYDATGHVADAEATFSYFRLPEKSDAEQDYSSAVDRLNSIEKQYLAIPSDDETEYDTAVDGKGVSISNYLEQNNYLTKETQETTIQQYLNEHKYITEEEFSEGVHYVTNDITGDLNTIYDGVEIKDLATTIGKVNGDESFSKSVATMMGRKEPEKEIYSISEAIQDITTTVVSNRDNNSAINARITMLISKLKDLDVLPEDFN